MKSLTKDPLKKLLYAYGTALVLVLVYYLIKQALFTPTEIDFKSFNTSSSTLTTPKDEESNDLKSPRFLLLPKK